MEERIEEFLKVPGIKFHSQYIQDQSVTDNFCLRFVAKQLADPSLLEGDLTKIQNPLFFFGQRSYQEIEVPKERDVVVYVHGYLSQSKYYCNSVEHLGVIKGQKVISRWGRLPVIFEHDLNAVPSYYGNLFALFRKINV